MTAPLFTFETTGLPAGMFAATRVGEE
jgi:hypothetical protein